ncbi:MAG: hypothetical protein MUC65_09635, partial [Pontiellaceae bacterium]|nr:hypothetical protein [Pontiellaceae bacterium]
IRASQYGAGGILWCWADEAIVRTDQSNRLDTAGNYSADGLVGPHGEKEASYFTVQSIWSPIQTSLTNLFEAGDDEIPLRNDFLFTDLKSCSFAWSLLNYSGPFSSKTETVIAQSGEAVAPSIAPGESGFLPLGLPKDWRTYDALELTACTAAGNSVFRKVWPLSPPDPLKAYAGRKPVVADGNLFNLHCGDAEWRFSPETGRLISSGLAGKPAGFSDGPFVVSSVQTNPAAGEWKVDSKRNGETVEITARNKTDDSNFRWRLEPGGLLALSYHFAVPEGNQNFWGIGFDLDESSVRAKRWQGGGPYRIWNNRRRGPVYGVWENEFNRGISGEVWDLPEFSGIFADVRWMAIELHTGGRLLLIPDASVNDIGVLRPPNSATAKAAVWDYPVRGGLFVFHQVPSVGTKFKDVDRMGPQSRAQAAPAFIDGTLRFILSPKPVDGQL